MIATHGNAMGQSLARWIRRGVQAAGAELEAKDAVGAPEETAHTLRDRRDARLIERCFQKDLAKGHVKLRRGAVDSVEQDAELRISRAAVRRQAELQRQPRQFCLRRA